MMRDLSCQLPEQLRAEYHCPVYLGELPECSGVCKWYVPEQAQQDEVAGDAIIL